MNCHCVISCRVVHSGGVLIHLSLTSHRCWYFVGKIEEYTSLALCKFLPAMSLSSKMMHF